MKKNITTIIILFFIAYACSKEDPNGHEGQDQPLEFTSLIAQYDTIQPGETTKITASATGYELSYYWSASLGDILGSGDEITYAASPCQVGTNKITCTVKDGNNHEDTKEIDIVVL